MNIAHILSSFGLGGQERLALNLATAQVNAGHRVTAVSLSDDEQAPLAQAFREAGVTTHSARKRGAGFDGTLPFRLAALLGQDRVQIVHTHNPQPLIYGAPAARLAGARVIHTKHGRNPVSPRRRWLIRGAAALVHAYVAVAPTTARVAEVNRECPNSRLRTISNGVDVKRFRRDAARRSEIRAQLGVDDTVVLIGTVGRLAPEKEQALLIRAARPLLGDRCQLVIVGDGPERLRLEQEIAESNVGPWVHLVGAQSNVEAWLSALDVFALTSSTEGLPLVIPEAMAAELAIVSTAVGGIPDVIDPGVTGVLTSAGDESAIRAALHALVTSPELARAMGSAACEVALGRYSLERMADDYMALYEDALQTPPGAARQKAAALLGRLLPERSYA